MPLALHIVPQKFRLDSVLPQPDYGTMWRLQRILCPCSDSQSMKESCDQRAKDMEHPRGD